MKTIIVIIASLFIYNAFPQSLITYPLNDKDFWQYENYVPNTYSTWQVIGDTTMVSNGITYKIVQRNGYLNDYRRFFEDKVYIYNSYYQEERVEYDFTLQPGDTVLYVPHENDTILVTLISIHFENIFGSYRKQWDFFIDYSPAFDDEVWITITDSIGLTSLFAFFNSLELVGAIINGITYGEIVSNEDIKNNLIKSFKIFQNYPNPFNLSTRIKYSVPQLSQVNIKVFDLLGKEIETLVNEEKPAGTYELIWNAGNHPSGIYFYQLSAADFIRTKKMILLK